MGANDDRSGGNKVFATITGDGRLKVKRGAEEGAFMYGNKPAEIFTYEDLQDVKHSEWAFIFTSYEGYIKDIREVEADFGLVLEIEMQDAGETWQISCGNKTNYAYDFLEKCMNIDFSEPVKLAPWSWDKNKDGKLKKGVTVFQGKDKDGKAIKIQSIFWDDKKRGNGYPDPGDTEGWNSDDWTAFYNTNVRRFLYKHLSDSIHPKLIAETRDVIDEAMKEDQNFTQEEPQQPPPHTEEDIPVPEKKEPF